VTVEIRDLDESDADLIDQLAHVLVDGFAAHAPEWLPTLEDAIEEIHESFEPGRRSRVLINTEQDVLGWIGAFEDEHCWEIHPIVVAVDHQRQGYGAMLVDNIAQLAREAGAVSLWAGTSDETNATSLSSADLYADPLAAMKNMTANENHAVNFWRKAGFTLVGVIPDGEGLGKPGIHFAKRIV